MATPWPSAWSLVYLLVLMVATTSAARYQVLKGSYTWFQAEEECHKKFQNKGRLASVNSHLEQKELVNILGEEKAWVGGNDLSVKGKWFWANGPEVTFKNWGTNQPSNSEKIRCMYIAKDGYWESAKCDGLAIFAVCESTNERYLMFPSEQATFYQAQKFCRTTFQGMGKMALPGNEQENKVLYQLSGNSNIWLDLHNLDSNKLFRLWDGASPRYKHWAPNEPSLDKESGDCVYMKAGQNGAWSDAKCTEEMGFACEMRGCPAPGN